MKNQQKIIVGLISVLILAGLFLILKPESQASGEEKTFVLTVQDNQLLGDKTLRAVEGDTIIIKVTSNVKDELHLHGYDESIELEHNKEATLTFVADKTGRFEFELEEAGVELGALEVSPK